MGQPISSDAILQANREVQAAIMKSSSRGKYNKYNDETRAAIGKYACVNGVAATFLES